jgi:hypothetical protein
LLYDLFFLSNKPLLETLADATLKRECRKWYTLQEHEYYHCCYKTLSS